MGQSRAFSQGLGVSESATRSQSDRIVQHSIVQGSAPFVATCSHDNAGRPVVIRVVGLAASGAGAAVRPVRGIVAATRLVATSGAWASPTLVRTAERVARSAPRSRAYCQHWIAATDALAIQAEVSSAVIGSGSATRGSLLAVGRGYGRGVARVDNLSPLDAVLRSELAYRGTVSAGNLGTRSRNRGGGQAGRRRVF